MDFWLAVANGTASDDDIKEFFCSRGCTAVADFPAAYFYSRLLKVLNSLLLRTLFVFKVFPEAKVILTKRSSESWQKSMRSSLLKVLPHSRFFGLDFRRCLQAYENRTTQPYRFMLFAFDWRFVPEQERVLWHLIF